MRALTREKGICKQRYAVRRFRARGLASKFAFNLAC